MQYDSLKHKNNGQHYLYFESENMKSVFFSLSSFLLLASLKEKSLCMLNTFYYRMLEKVFIVWWCWFLITKKKERERKGKTYVKWICIIFFLFSVPCKLDFYILFHWAMAEQKATVISASSFIGFSSYYWSLIADNWYKIPLFSNCFSCVERFVLMRHF